MGDHMNQIILFFGFVLLLFILMITFMEVGRRVGVRRRKQEGEASPKDSAPAMAPYSI
jgi:hypothetical protein